MNVVQCPSCDRSLQVPESLMGAQVKCPKCQNVFTAGQPGAAPPPPPPPPEDEPPREQFSDAPSEPRRPVTRRDEDFDRGRDRGRDRWRDDDEDYGVRRGSDRETARSAVAGPAIALMVTGGLAAGFGVLSLILNLIGAAAGAGGAGGPPDEVAINAVSGIGGALFGIAWGAVIFTGSMKMKNLESYGFAMAACIIAMLPCNGCCILGLPFGIWGLVQLNQPHVKDAFGTGYSPPRPRRDYD